MPTLMADIRNASWWRMFRHALPIYVLSRLCVVAGAAVVAAELRHDANFAIENGLEPDPDGLNAAGSAVEPITNVLTSWDGLWYMDIVRHGYPTSIPPDITYFQNEARAAFFPLFPMLGRAASWLIPGGDTFAVLALNVVLGLVAVILIGLLGQRLYGERVGKTTATLVAMFPGSFVLSFAYSEALMLVLAAACMLCLHDRRWLTAGLFAALTTATRPNGVAIVVACAVAAVLAIREQRERHWQPLAAVLLSPIGFIVFQVWLGQHTGESGAWFRVQREAWGEGASFGWTAIKNTGEAFSAPLTSPTDTITAISFLATLVLLWLAWHARMPWWMNAYSLTVVALMLAPATVTARPRFVFTAFPLLIAAARWYEDRRRTDDSLWPVTMAACGAGLATLAGLYGVYGAIP